MYKRFLEKIEQILCGILSSQRVVYERVEEPHNNASPDAAQRDLLGISVSGSPIPLVPASPLHRLLVGPVIGVFKVGVHISLCLHPSDILVGHVLQNSLLVLIRAEQTNQERFGARPNQRTDRAICSFVVLVFGRLPSLREGIIFRRHPEGSYAYCVSGLRRSEGRSQSAASQEGEHCDGAESVQHSGSLLVSFFPSPDRKS
mmetsp:Transcript_31306/g.57782  ORF Transcript_31306/g.57782 Transcript_31306/m.57782 type:complete len:202 (-) Transcript_31306:60-665(-)